MILKGLRINSVVFWMGSIMFGHGVCMHTFVSAWVFVCVCVCVGRLAKSHNKNIRSKRRNNKYFFNTQANQTYTPYLKWFNISKQFTNTCSAFYAKFGLAPHAKLPPHCVFRTTYKRCRISLQLATGNCIFIYLCGGWVSCISLHMYPPCPPLPRHVRPSRGADCMHAVPDSRSFQLHDWDNEKPSQLQLPIPRYSSDFTWMHDAQVYNQLNNNELTMIAWVS
jgi:hypothetical protein